MLSTLVVSALLVLQTGFAVADSATGSVGRKSFLPSALQPRHRLLVRQDATCPAGSFLCNNGVGCCDIGTTCGYSALNNAPVCNGGTCDGGPICSDGLCCDLGYVCDEVNKLCTKDTSGGGDSSSSLAEPTFVISSSIVRDPPATLTSALSSSSSAPSGSDDESSSSDFNFDDNTTSSFQPAAATQTSDSTPTSGSGFDGSNSQPTTVRSTFNTNVPVVTKNAASDLSANSGVKIFAGAVAGVLAFVL